MADPAGHSGAQASYQLGASMVRSLQPMIPTEESAASIASPTPANSCNNQPINPQSEVPILSIPHEQQKMLLNFTRERFTAIGRYPAMIGFVQQLVDRQLDVAILMAKCDQLGLRWTVAWPPLPVMQTCASVLRDALSNGAIVIDGIRPPINPHFRPSSARFAQPSITSSSYFSPSQPSTSGVSYNTRPPLVRYHNPGSLPAQQCASAVPLPPQQQQQKAASSRLFGPYSKFTYNCAFCGEPFALPDNVIPSVVDWKKMHFNGGDMTCVDVSMGNQVFTHPESISIVAAGLVTEKAHCQLCGGKEIDSAKMASHLRMAHANLHHAVQTPLAPSPSPTAAVHYGGSFESLVSHITAAIGFHHNRPQPPSVRGSGNVLQLVNTCIMRQATAPARPPETINHSGQSTGPVLLQSVLSTPIQIRPRTGPQVSTTGPPDETSSTSTAAVTEPPSPAISDVEAAVGLRSLHRKRIESPRLNQDMVEAKKVKTLPTTEDADAARLSPTPLGESVGYVTIDESDGPPMYFCFCGRSGPCEKEIDEHCRRHRRKEDVPTDQLHLFCHHPNCRYFALDNDDYAKHSARHNLIQTLFRRAAFAKKAINTAAVAD